MTVRLIAPHHPSTLQIGYGLFHNYRWRLGGRRRAKVYEFKKRLAQGLVISTEDSLEGDARVKAVTRHRVLHVFVLEGP